MSDIYYCQSKNNRIPVRPQIFKHGSGIYVSFTNDQALNLSFIGSGAAVASEFRRIADLIEQALATRDQGHISRPEVEPRQHKITIEHLQGVDDETAMSLLIERFRNSDAKIYTALLADYYTLTKRHYKGTSDADLEFDDLPAIAAPPAAPSPAGRGQGEGRSQLHRDLETIRPHLSTLIQNGQPVRGIQTRVAELLNITNAGATNRQRLLKIIRVLETHLVNNSSTTSSTAAEPPANPNSKASRAA